MTSAGTLTSANAERNASTAARRGAAGKPGTSVHPDHDRRRTGGRRQRVDIERTQRIFRCAGIVADVARLELDGRAPAGRGCTASAAATPPRAAALRGARTPRARGGRARAAYVARTRALECPRGLRARVLCGAAGRLAGSQRGPSSAGPRARPNRPRRGEPRRARVGRRGLACHRAHTGGARRDGARATRGHRRVARLRVYRRVVARGWATSPSGPSPTAGRIRRRVSGLSWVDEVGASQPPPRASRAPSSSPCYKRRRCSASSL